MCGWNFQTLTCWDLSLKVMQCFQVRALFFAETIGSKRCSLPPYMCKMHPKCKVSTIGWSWHFHIRNFAILRLHSLYPSDFHRWFVCLKYGIPPFHCHLGLTNRRIIIASIGESSVFPFHILIAINCETVQIYPNIIKYHIKLVIQCYTCIIMYNHVHMYMTYGIWVYPSVSPYPHFSDFRHVHSIGKGWWSNGHLMAAGYLADRRVSRELRLFGGLLCCPWNQNTLVLKKHRPWNIHWKSWSIPMNFCENPLEWRWMGVFCIEWWAADLFVASGVMPFLLQKDSTRIQEISRV